MAPFMQYLFSSYGLFGTLLICGALMLNCTAMGALYRPLRIIHADQDFHDSKPLRGVHHTNRLAKQMMTTDDFGSVHSIHTKSNKKNEQDDLLPYVEVDTKVEDKSDEKHVEEGSHDANKERTHSCLKTALGGCSKGLDLALLKNTEYMTLSLVSGFAITIAITNVVFLASYAESKGFSQTDITFLLVAINFADIPLRLLSGFLFDLKCVRRNGYLVYALFCMLSGVCAGLLAVSDNKVYCYIVWILLQTVSAVTLVQSTTVMTDIIGKTSC